jgi:hypothetical protein
LNAKNTQQSTIIYSQTFLFIFCVYFRHHFLWPCIEEFCCIFVLSHSTLLNSFITISYRHDSCAPSSHALNMNFYINLNQFMIFSLSLCSSRSFIASLARARELFLPSLKMLNLFQLFVTRFVSSPQLETDKFLSLKIYHQISKLFSSFLPLSFF